MSGYSDYIMSASSSIADIVNNASTAAAAAAGQVACQVSPDEMLNLHLIIVTILQVTDACHTVAQSAQQKFLSYKYEPGKASGMFLQDVFQMVMTYF